ncbi:hypothetical protein MRX96_000554 [Rhipicephalus microplus]
MWYADAGYVMKNIPVNTAAASESVNQSNIIRNTAVASRSFAESFSASDVGATYRSPATCFDEGRVDEGGSAPGHGRRGFAGAVEFLFTGRGT